jgi:hypothetical protein
LASRSQDLTAEDDATMAAHDDMREEIRSLESRFDGLEKKVDQLPTKDDLSRFATKDDLLRFATKDDLVAFKDEIINNFRILAEDAKDSAKKAAEGFGATLYRIETDLADLNTKMDTKFSDHDKALGDHNERLMTLERARRRSRRS